MLANAFQMEKLSLVVAENESDSVHNISSHYLACISYYRDFTSDRSRTFVL